MGIEPACRSRVVQVNVLTLKADVDALKRLAGIDQKNTSPNKIAPAPAEAEPALP